VTRQFVVVILGGVFATSTAAQDRGRTARDTGRAVLERVVVTASRREERLKDVVVETELITRAALERTGAADLASALQEAAGLQIDGGTPAGVGVSLRGFDSRRVLVLIDGQPYVGRLAGHLDLSRIPIQNIQRVEVVRGPQSTLYGADALGGVVNIITQRPAMLRRTAAVSLVGGTNGRREGSATVAAGGEHLALRLDGGRRLTSLAPGVSDDDATYHRAWNGTARAIWTPNASATVDFSSHGVRESQRYRTGQLYRFADNRQFGLRAGSEQRRGSSRWSQTISYSRFDHTARTSTMHLPASDSGAGDRQSLTQLQLGFTTLLGIGVVDAGVDLRDERIRADRILGDARNAQSVEPFLQLSAQRGRVTVAPGIRASLHETWGAFYAPRVAVAARLSDRVTLRSSLGTGYRAPDFKELYLNFANPAAGYAVEGNPALRPERSVSGSLGVHTTADKWSARVTTFANRFRDFITTSEQDAAGIFHYENIESGTTHGIESELMLSSDLGSVEFAYDYTASRDRRSRAPLPGIAPHQGRIVLSPQPIAGFSLTLATYYSAATPLQRVESGQLLRERGAYARTDVRIARPVADRVRARAGLSNLFDRALGDAWPGFTGRQFFAGIDWYVTGVADERKAVTTR
jgi:outer membrane receptor for ferrienterochelin and colicins